MHVPDRPRADRRRLGQHAQPAQRLRHRDQVLGRHDRQLGGEAVQPRDAVLGVVAGVARVGRARGARAAVPARPPHGRRDEVAAREAVAGVLDAAEQLVAEDEPLLAGGRDAEPALGDLAIGPADADLERAHQHLAARGPRLGHLRHGGRAGHSRAGDERLHHPSGGARRTAPSAAEPTQAR